MTYLQLDHIITKRRTSGWGNPGDAALMEGDREFSYSDLAGRAAATAARLHHIGIRAGDRVVVLMRNRVEWIDTFFALAKLRAVLVPASPLWALAELRYVAEDSEANYMITEDALAEQVEEIAYGFAHRLLAIGARPGWTSLADVTADAGSPVVEAAKLDDPFLLQYTSGATGRPKAAVHTQNTILLNALALVSDMSITRTDRCMILASLAWVAGLHALALPTLLAGGVVVLYPNEAIEVNRLAQEIARSKPTITAMVPTLMRKMLDAAEVTGQQVSSLRMILTGSSPVPLDVMKEMSDLLPECDVVQAYGMTEFPSSGVILRPEDAPGHFGSVGKAGLLTQVRVVTADGDDAAAGEVGEIWTQAASMAKGYWNAPESTGSAFVDGWFRTGDLGTMDEDGFIYVVGRQKDVIISGGLNIYAAEVERVLCEHPDVTEAAVLGRADEQWGETSVAFVVAARGLTEAALTDHCRESLAKYKVPKEWFVRSDPLPRTSTGKLQKFRLAKILEEQSIPVDQGFLGGG